MGIPSLADARSELEKSKAGDTLEVSPQLLAQLGLLDLFRQHELPCSLSLTIQSSSSEADCLRVSGSGRVFDEQTDLFTLILFEEGSIAAVDRQQPLRLGAAVGRLPAQTGFRDGQAAQVDNHLVGVKVESLVLVISTLPKTEFAQRSIEPGLNGWGRITTVELLSDSCAWLDCAETSEYSLSGSSQDGVAAASLQVLAPMPQPWKRLGFTDAIIQVASSGGGGNGTEPVACCRWGWTLQDYELDLEAAVVLSRPGSTITANATYAGRPLALADAVGLFGLTFDGALVPAGLGALTFSSAAVQLDLERCEVRQLTLNFQLGASWQVIPDSLYLDARSAQLSLQAPFSAPKPTLKLAGQASFRGLSALASYNSARGAVSLRVSAPVALNELLDGLLPTQVELPLPDVETATLTFDLNARRLTLDGTIGRGLTFRLGAESVQLARAHLRASLDLRTPGNSQLRASATVDLFGERATFSLSSGLQSLISLSLSRASLAGIANTILRTKLPRWLDVELSSVALVLTPRGDVQLRANVELGVSRLLEQALIDAPLALSGIAVTRVSLDYRSDDGSWSVSLMGGDPDAKLSREEEVVVRSFSLSYSGGAGASATQIALGVAARFQIDGETRIDVSEARLEWSSAQEAWSIGGSASTSFLGVEHELAVSGTAGANTSSWSFTLDSESTLVEWPTASITIRKLEFRADGQDERYRYAAAGLLSATIECLGDIDFGVSLVVRDEGKELAIRAELDGVRLSVPLAPVFDGAPCLGLLLNELQIAVASGLGLQLRGTAVVTLDGVPECVAGYFPKQATGSLAVSKAGLCIDANLSVPIDFPALELSLASGVSLDLGRPSINLSRLRFEIYRDEARKKLQVELSSEMVIGAAGFNRLFGVDAHDNPNIEWVNPEFGLALVLGRHPSLRLLSSPFKALLGEYRNRRLQATLDLGEYGAFDLQVPEFTFAAGRVEASGGFHVVRQLKLPFFAFKWLLAKMGVPSQVTDLWPDAMPLSHIDLNSTSLADVLTALIGSPATRRLDATSGGAITFLSEQVDGLKAALPKRMAPYLDIRVPEQLDVALAIGGGGSTAFSIVARDDQPLKLLLPNAAPMPELLGVQLRRIGLGQYLGGSVYSLELDADIDRFDLANLMLGVALGNSNELENHYTVRDLLAVGPTAIPIPIPLVFSELQWSYRDALGFELGSKLLQRQQFDFAGILALIEDLREFFLKPEFLLHVAEGKLEWSFEVGPNYLKPPDLLGEATLGDDELVVTLDAYDAVARVLDTLKTGNAGYLIEALPLRVGQRWIRIGQGSLFELGPINLSATWCICTQSEYQRVLLVEDDTRQMLEALGGEKVLRALPSKTTTDYAKGFVVLLAGRWAVAELLELNCKLGTALTGAGRFGFGLCIEGGLSDVLTLSFQGDLEIIPRESRYSLTGIQSVDLFGQSVLRASAIVAIDQERLHVGVALTCGSFELADARLEVGALPSGGRGVALAFQWFDGRSRQCFELAYRDGQAYFITELVFIQSSVLTVKGEALLSLGIHGVRLVVHASMNIANGFVQGQGRIEVDNGLFTLTLGGSIAGFGCTLSATAGVEQIGNPVFLLSVDFDTDGINRLASGLTASVTHGLDEANSALQKKKRQLAAQERQLDGKVLTWEHFRGPFNKACGEVQRIVKQEIENQPRLHRGLVRAAAEPFFSAMQEIQQRVDSNWQNFTWQDINKHLDLALKASKIKIEFLVREYERDLLSSSQRRTLEKAKSRIKNLRGEINIAVNAKDAATTAVQVAESGLARAHSMTEVRLTRVSIAASIQQFGTSELRCDVQANVLGKEESKQVIFAPSPEELARSVYRAFLG